MKKLKRLMLASSTSMAFAIVCLMSIPVNAGTGYYYVPHYGSGTNWGCGAFVELTYETPGDTINYPPSEPWYSAWSQFDVSHTVMHWENATNTYNILQAVEVDFTSWFDEWTVDAESWSYPQYDPQPTGGHYIIS